MKRTIKFLQVLFVSGLFFYVAGTGFCGTNSVADVEAQDGAGQVGGADRDIPDVGIGREQMIKSTIVIVLVLALLVGANIFIKKRAGTFKGLGGTRIKVLERRGIDTKRALFLISVDGKKLLIGVGAQQIETLCEFSDEPGLNTSGTDENGKASI